LESCNTFKNNILAAGNKKNLGTVGDNSRVFNILPQNIEPHGLLGDFLLTR
jgi:hypothetical protein